MNKIILSGIVAVIVSCIVAATAWNFSAVAGMHEKYVTVEENQADHKRIEDKLDEIYRILIGRE